jgi:hypothetical protein
MPRSSAAVTTLSTQLDMKTLTELFDENAWHTPGRGSIAGDPREPGQRVCSIRPVWGETGGRCLVVRRLNTLYEETTHAL